MITPDMEQIKNKTYGLACLLEVAEMGDAFGQEVFECCPDPEGHLSFEINNTGRKQKMEDYSVLDINNMRIFFNQTIIGFAGPLATAMLHDYKPIEKRLCEMMQDEITRLAPAQQDQLLNCGGVL